MNAIAEFTIIPIGVGVSLSKYVTVCEKILEESGLSYELHANGTNLEGKWDEVMDAIKTCHERLHEMGVPRIATQIKIGTRTDRAQKMTEKIASVREKFENNIVIGRGL
ncbi:MAG: MTH1187 family thiamine-binding protein [Anaerolineales bacterium]